MSEIQNRVWTVIWNLTFFWAAWQGMKLAVYVVSGRTL